MALNIPTECPTCATGGIRSAVRLYQVNLEEAAVLCENPNCPFPLFSLDTCPLTVPRLASSVLQTDQWKSSTDTDSIVSSYSVSSWTSQDSTISNVSSAIATPPPNITGRPALLNQKAPIYYPKAVLPEQVRFPYDWSTPVGSTQTSPALSVISGTDREVESVMNSLCNVNQTSDLTPSPSPLVDNVMDQNFDDFDSFIASAFSSVSDSNESKAEKVDKNPPPEFKSVKKTPTTSQLFPSMEKIQKRLASSRAASEPSRKRPAKALQTTKHVVASPRTPQPLANQSQVALQVNEEGTAVFTIVPPSPKVAKTETSIVGVSPLNKKSSVAATRLPTGIGLKRLTAATKSPRQTVAKLTPINAIVNQFLKQTYRRPSV